MKINKGKILSVLLTLMVAFSSVSVTFAAETSVDSIPTDIQIIEVSENASEQEIDQAIEAAENENARIGYTTLTYYGIRSGNTEECHIEVRWQGNQTFNKWICDDFVISDIETGELIDTFGGGTIIVPAAKQGTVTYGYIFVPLGVDKVRVEAGDISAFCLETANYHYFGSIARNVVLN